MRRQLC